MGDRIQWKENIKNLLKGEKKVKIVIIVGFIGILLIFMSEMMSNNSTKTETKASIKTLSLDTDGYKGEIESELVKILSRISGVGSAEVMVTIEGTTEYVFAEDVNSNSTEGNDQKSEQTQSKIVIIEKNGEKEALVKKIIKPQITGVIIVCEGGDNPIVSEKVYTAVATALGISTNRICVAKG